jgi:hypothetical protein
LARSANCKPPEARSPGTTNRVHEQLGYGYDAAGNLDFRSNNAITQTFWSLSRNYWQAL